MRYPISDIRPFPPASGQVFLFVLFVINLLHKQSLHLNYSWSPTDATFGEGGQPIRYPNSLPTGESIAQTLYSGQRCL